MNANSMLKTSTRLMTRLSSLRFLLGSLLLLCGAFTNVSAQAVYYVGPNKQFTTIQAAVSALVPFQEDVVLYVDIGLRGYKQRHALSVDDFNGHTLKIFGVRATRTSATYYQDEELEYRVNDDGSLNETVEYTDAGEFTARRVSIPTLSDPYNEFYLKNGLGSTVGVVGYSGSPMGSFYEYHAYGTYEKEWVSGESHVTHTYTGKELDFLGDSPVYDGSGLYHFGARYYDADIGLWLGVDPDYETYSPYTFAANNPLAFTDADGRNVYTKAGKVIYRVIKTGDAASAFADNIKDCAVLFNNAAPLSARLKAGLSLASEFAPVSVGDIKDGIKIGKFVANKVKKFDDVVPKAAEKIAYRVRGGAPNSRPGMPFTVAGKDEVWKGNAKKFDGVNKCEKCGIEVVKPQQHTKGVAPPKNEGHVDHRTAQSKGGSGTPDNGDLLCRVCNIDKSNH